MTANDIPLPLEEGLSERLSWLIRLRWAALAGIVLLVWATKILLGLPVPDRDLYLVALGIFLYNTSFYLHHKRLIKLPPAEAYRPLRRFTATQIYIDWFALTVLIHLTGGIESPVLIYFLFHVIIAQLILLPRHAYIQPTIAVVVVGALALMEYCRLVNHITLGGFRAGSNFQNPLYILGQIFFFATAIYVITYLLASIVRRLRERTNRLVRLQEELKGTAQRMETLYALAKDITSSLDLREVMGLITKNTAQLMRVKGCTIRLLDQTGTKLELHGSYGLSERYLGKGPLDVDKSVQDARIGQPVAILDVTRDPRVQYPREAREEGIFSMLGVPLRMQEEIIGTLRIHTAAAHEFTEEEIRFFTAIAGTASIAVTNALAYRRLLEQDEDRSHLMLTVAHEMKAPVSAIQGITDVLLGGYLGDLAEKQKELIRRARGRTESFITLINDLLDMGGDYLGKNRDEPLADVPLAATIREVADLFAVPAGEKGIHLSAELPEREYVLAERKGDMEKLFTNLISNAVKYSPPGGGIAISAIETDEYLRITVSDAGIGIPADDLPHIFEEFYRAGNARKSGEEGTGLGLPLVKNIIKRYSGRIDVESRLGEGTTFTLDFPWARIKRQ